MYAIPIKGFQSLGDLTRDFEAYLLTSALRRGKGLKKEAAAMLGCTRQALDYMLAGRHKALRHVVTPVAQGRNGHASRRKAK